MRIAFKNVSQFPQLGVEPGETGEAVVSEEKCDRLVMRGAIEVTAKDVPEPVAGEEQPAVAAEGDQSPEKKPEEIAAEQKAAEEAAAAEQQSRRGRSR